MNILFTDISSTGHHQEFIRHIVDFTENKQKIINNDIYYFLLGEKSEYSNKFISTPKIKYIFWDSQNSNEKSIHKNKKCLEYISDCISRYSIDKVFFMYLNDFFYSLPLYNLNVKFSGILFHSPYCMKWSLSLKNNVLRLRRYLSIFLISRKKNLETIFILNDTQSVDYFNSIFDSKFKFLPDPIPLPIEEKINDEIDINDFFSKNNGKKFFLHIGSMDYRKGTDLLIDSIKLLEPDVLKESIFLFVGKIPEKFKACLTDLKKEKPNNIHIHDAFVSDNQFALYFKRSNYIVVPYRNTESSSGIIGQGISYRKIIIAPFKGIIKNLFGEYPGFLPLKMNSKEEIAELISKAITNAYNIGPKSDHIIKKFLDEKSPNHFVSKILDVLKSQ